MPTEISWTDETWNPVVGCQRISAGCEHCYAERMAYRLARIKKTRKRYEGLTTKGSSGIRWTGAVRLVPEVLEEPLRWRKPRKIFVCSMSDLFHEDVPDEYLSLVFAAMAQAPHHTFQLLTKRPRRMFEWFTSADRHLQMTRAFRNFADYTEPVGPWPLPNVWLGVTAENQQAADERIPLLLQTPAAVRFVSAEPLLGPIDFHIPTKTWGPRSDGTLGCDHCCNGDRCDEPGHFDRRRCPYCRGSGEATFVNQIIVGGESGPGARPCNIEWIRSTVQQCREANVACWVKQLGACYVDELNGVGGAQAKPDLSTVPDIRRLRDAKGADMGEWPEDLQVREFPAEKPAAAAGEARE